MRFKILYRSIICIGSAMDSVPLLPANRPHKISSRSVLWLAGTSAFLLTGFASGPDDSSAYIVSGKWTHVAHNANRTDLKADEMSAVPPSPEISAAASTRDVPTTDSASFNDRFSGP